MDIQPILRRLSDAALSGELQTITQRERDRRTLGPLAYRIKYGRCRSTDRSIYELAEPPPNPSAPPAAAR